MTSACTDRLGGNAAVVLGRRRPRPCGRQPHALADPGTTAREGCSRLRRRKPSVCARYEGRDRHDPLFASPGLGRSPVITGPNPPGHRNEAWVWEERGGERNAIACSARVPGASDRGRNVLPRWPATDIIGESGLHMATPRRIHGVTSPSRAGEWAPRFRIGGPGGGVIKKDDT